MHCIPCRHNYAPLLEVTAPGMDDTYVFEFGFVDSRVQHHATSNDVPHTLYTCSHEVKPMSDSDYEEDKSIKTCERGKN